MFDCLKGKKSMNSVSRLKKPLDFPFWKDYKTYLMETLETKNIMITLRNWWWRSFIQMRCADPN